MNYSLWGKTSSPLSSMLNFYNCFLLPWFITISPYGFSFTQKHLYLLTLCGQHQHLKNLFLWLVWKLEHWEWLWASFYFMYIVELDPKSTNEACWCNIDDRKLDRVCYISKGYVDNTTGTYNARDNHLKKSQIS